MRVAVVLFGQPRDYLKGYNNTMAFIKQQKDCKFDFFYHTWKLNENEKQIRINILSFLILVETIAAIIDVTNAIGINNLQTIRNVFKK